MECKEGKYIYENNDKGFRNEGRLKRKAASKISEEELSSDLFELRKIVDRDHAMFELLDYMTKKILVVIRMLERNMNIRLNHELSRVSYDKIKLIRKKMSEMEKHDDFFGE